MKPKEDKCHLLLSTKKAPVTKAEQNRLKACLGATKLGTGENKKNFKVFYV